MGNGETEQSISRGEQRGSGELFSVGEPVDLVGNIRAMVQQGRAEWERVGMGRDFNTAWFLRDSLSTVARHTFSQVRRLKALNPSFEEIEGLEEKQDFIDDVRVAWQLVAYEQLIGEKSNNVYTDIRTHRRGRSSITLSPLGVTLLDAMAEALDIPHRQGQAKFDVSLFSGQAAREKIRSGAQSLAPTVEEVKKALATSVDAVK